MGVPDMKGKVNFFNCFILIILLLIPTVLSAKAAQITFRALGSSVEAITYDNIPFQIYGANLEVQKTPWNESYEDVYTMPDWSTYNAYKVHFIQTSIWALDLVNGTVVGQIQVCYREDATCDSVNLVMGENTAEWSYDRPENQPFLGHTKIPPAYSYWTNIDSDYWYWGHTFYASVDTNPDKTLDYVKLVLDAATSENLDYLGLAINAITIESSEAPPQINGGGVVPCENGKDCTFALNARWKEGEPWPTGFLFFRDPDAGLMLRADDFRRFSPSGSVPGTIFLTGWGQVNNEEGYRFTLWAADNGNPGAGNDSFRLRIIEYETDETYEIDQILIGGNIIEKKTK
jgi:hypothetical protein